MRILLTIFCSVAFLHGQPAPSPQTSPNGVAPDKPKPGQAEKPAEPAKAPSVTKLENGMMKVGEVTFDPKTRQIFVPCTVNMNEGMLEYAIVHEGGKVHESLLKTKASPTDINVAFKLLRYVESPELFPLPRENYETPVQYPIVSDEVRKGARVDLNLEWQVEGKSKKAALAEWIHHGDETKLMGKEPWVYGGSMMYGGKFVAESTGDIASICVVSASILLYAGQDDDNDEMWHANHDAMPAKDSPVTLVISPHKP